MNRTSDTPFPRGTSPHSLLHITPGRTRGDGWTPVTQAEFIGELAETRSVTEAARRMGMTRETAYRLRRRKWSASFCAAWDTAMGRPVMPFRPKFEGAGLMVARLEKLGLRGRALGMTPPGPISADEAAPISRVTNAELAWRCETGIWSVILRRGKYAVVIRKADDFALLRLVARTDRLARRCDAEASASGKSRV
ncbi:helix-turn-helix domain-containing protein [Erythrobacter vulgaris]|uniref:Helix-turn-helix domain-containing protein n=1 Tax=Qipengyuania vulgaris TaxID=291985 RepID=A0A844XUP9_9SPHN|nr:helix-turn-helix domain-containing protein [Qipengyuania vulgaris]MXO49214.1 helix-turn-helix domain-containing protein [Qipengyuania vulgaris]